MARNDRRGERQTREHLRRANGRVPELGYYTVITDTKETERNYFEGLRDSLPSEFRGKLVIKVISTKTSDLISEGKKIQARNSQYSRLWIVFDRDLVPNFDGIIEEAEKQNMQVGWSNPCFEIWLWAYFGKMPEYQDSQECWEGFAERFEKETEYKYSKSYKKLYQDLCNAGNEQEAIKLASKKYEHSSDDEKKRKPSEKISVTTVYQLVDEIRKKTEKAATSTQ